MGFGKPISKWAMQETTGITVADSIGSSTGTATSGNARRFNGTSDKITFTNHIIPVGAKTIRFKFRKAANPSANGMILDNSNVDGTKIFISNLGKVVFWIKGGATLNIASSISVCDNVWHEIMVTWDGTATAGTAKIFIDDMINPHVTGTASNTETTDTTNLFVGCSSTSAQFLAFDIDDLQITNGYQGAGTVVAWWKMDDAAATAMVDSSSNAWAPTITGTTVLTNDSMPIIVSDGAGGYARRFNGRGDRVTFTSQVLPLGAKSIRFKVRITLKPDNNQTILDNTTNNGASANGTMILLRNTGQFSFISYTGGQSRFSFNSNVNICDNQWHEILCVWDGTTGGNGAKIFVDDMTVPKNQATATSTETVNAAGNLFVGAVSSATPSLFFQGDLKDITISVGTGTERTNPKDLQVGDFIRANYAAGTSGAVGVFSQLGTANNPFISAASSATPNGDFYYICVDTDYLGRKKLIADRNIQHMISWDTLNTKGIASGSGLPIELLPPDFFLSGVWNDAGNKVTETISSNQVSITGCTTSSSDWANPVYDYLTYSQPLDALNYFKFTALVNINNNNTTTTIANLALSLLDDTNATLAKMQYNDAWGTMAQATPSATINGVTTSGTMITTANIIQKVDIELDGLNLNIWLDDTLFASGALTKKPKYLALGSAKFSGYTFYPSASVRLFGSTSKTRTQNFTTRLLTGGTASTDKDNEWDNYIVNSTLNGTIAAGDNNVWNWSGVSSWSSSVNSGGATYRTVRGNTLVTYSGYNATTATSATSTGFRPVLLVEDVIVIYKKALVLENGAYKAFVNGSWVTITTVAPTENDFVSNGMELAGLLTNEQFNLLGDTFKIVVYSNGAATPKVSPSRSYPTVGTRIMKQ